MTKRTTVLSTGGTVVVQSNGNLHLVAAFPSPGFDVENDSDVPDRIRVEFESEQHRSEIRVEWEGDS